MYILGSSVDTFQNVFYFDWDGTSDEAGLELWFHPLVCSLRSFRAVFRELLHARLQSIIKRDLHMKLADF